MSESSADLVLAASGRVENKESLCRKRHSMCRFWLGQSNYGVYCGED